MIALTRHVANSNCGSEFDAFAPERNGVGSRCRHPDAVMAHHDQNPIAGSLTVGERHAAFGRRLP